MLKTQKMTVTSLCWRLFLIGSLILGLAGLPGGEPARAQSGADPNPSLVRDINQDPAEIYTSQILSMNGDLYFSLYNYSSTCQLWKSDGTTQGTQLFLEMNYLPIPNAYVHSFGCLNQIVAGQKLFFINSDPEHGSELWVTDGTPGGTGMVADFVPGPEGIGIFNWVESGGELYFLASDGVHGASLWKTDGSQAGSVLLYSTFSIASPAHANVIPYTPPTLFSNQGLVYFIGNDADSGQELWRSDGTPGGTYLLKDIYPGAGSSDPTLVTTVGSTVYFSAYDGVHFMELWKSDGSSSGTQLLNSGFNYLEAVLNGNLYFKAYDDVHGEELWFSDGTKAGTYLLKDINPGTGSSYPGDAHVFGGLVLFSARDEEHGIELWRTDGTTAGTYLVKDILAGADDGSPQLLDALNGQFYLLAQDASGWQLFKTDGNLDSASVVRPLNMAVYGISSATVLNGYLYFNVYPDQFGTSLWRSDGGAGGTSMIFSPPDGGILLGQWNDSLLYLNRSGNKNELWLVDGPSQKTTLLASSVSVQQFLVLGNAFYFITSGYQQPNSLWRSDGSPAGTQVVRDISGTGDSLIEGVTPTPQNLYFGARPNAFKEDIWAISADGESRNIVPGYIDLQSQLNSQTDLLDLDGQLLFHIDQFNPDYTPGLWRSDGTPAGTALIRGEPFRFIHIFTRVGQDAYFVNLDLSIASDWTWWRSDGTTTGTLPLADFGPTGRLSSIIDVGGKAFAFGQKSADTYFLIISNGTVAGTQYIHEFCCNLDSKEMLAWNGNLYFVEPGQLWVSDGTTNGTTSLGYFTEPADHLSPPVLGLTGLGNQVFFAAGDGDHGTELWRTDGSVAGTVLVKDIYSGTMGSDPLPVATIGSTLYFTADDGIHGRELWRSDGTEAGTRLVKDILAGAEGAQPESFAVLDGTLYFAADDGASGRELWRSDGTEAGTYLVKDILPGAGGSAPQVSVQAGLLYLAANDGVHGIEPWVSDGTESGTTLMGDVNPGQASSLPSQFTSWRGKVYFKASDFEHGRELWVYDLGLTARGYMPLVAR